MGIRTQNVEDPAASYDGERVPSAITVSGDTVNVRVFLSANCPEASRYLDELPSITICRATPGGSIPRADLYVGIQPSNRGTGVMGSARNTPQVVLANPRDLEQVAAMQSVTGVLWRPVSPMTARAFVDLAFKSRDARQRSDELDALRLDRDALLNAFSK